MRGCALQAIVPGVGRWLSRCAVWLFVIVLFLVGVGEAGACSVCFGAKGSADAEAAGWAILSMLLMLVPVLVSFLAFAVYLAVQSRKVHSKGVLSWVDSPRLRSL